jgi:hypothetical protein
MSAGTRICIAVIGFLAAGLFAYVGLAGMIEQNTWLVWVLAAACLLIGLASIPGKHSNIIGRVLAALIFLFILAYLITSYIPSMQDPHSAYGPRDAWKLFLIWGIPTAFFACRGFYPRWGKYGQAFGKDTTRKPK